MPGDEGVISPENAVSPGQHGFRRRGNAHLPAVLKVIE
jgi:hypothetical protein